MELLKDGQGFYHTRRESFLRIQFVTAPNSFWEVRAKDGTVSRYGSSLDGSRTDCRIAKPGGGPTFAWLLCEREDPNGNALAVFYDSRGDAGTTYPKEIRYTLRRGAGGLESISSGHDRVVEFVTEVRPDTTEGYRAGFLEKQTQRLRRIDVSVDGSLAQGGTQLRRYELDYGTAASSDSFRSLLRAVKLYGTDAASTPPTAPRVWSFDYRASTPGWQAGPSWAFPSNVFFTRADGKDGGTRLADMNGDGLPDLVREVREATTVENDAYSGSPATPPMRSSLPRRMESWRFSNLVRLSCECSQELIDLFARPVESATRVRPASMGATSRFSWDRDITGTDARTCSWRRAVGARPRSW
jgi:hypothetical protein